MKITFINSKDGSEKTVSFSSGQTILEVARENEIHIISSCEGFGVCGSCHVKIENLQDKLPSISEHENDTLDRVSGLSSNSRLACQVVLNEDLDGLRVRIMN